MPGLGSKPLPQPGAGNLYTRPGLGSTEPRRQPSLPLPAEVGLGSTGPGRQQARSSLPSVGLGSTVTPAVGVPRGQTQTALRSGVLGGLSGNRSLLGHPVRGIGHQRKLLETGLRFFHCPAINRTMEYPSGLEGHGPMGSLIYRKQAAKFLGVSPKTIDNYVKAGVLKPYKNQVNGRVYFDQADVLKLLGSRLPQDRGVVLYCRAAPMPNRGNAGVSAEKRLAEQVERCTLYCSRAGIRIDQTVAEIGRGESFNGRKGWAEIMELVLRKRVSMIVVETLDRLCRWGMAETFAHFLAWHGVELHVIQPVLQLQEYRDELTEDLTNIVYQARQLMGT